MPKLSCRKLADTFNRLHAKHHISVGRTWVNDVTRQHRHEIVLLRRKLKHRQPRPVAINQTWGMDLTGKGDSNGKQHNILGLIDHGSRRALRLIPLTRKNSLTLIGHLLIAIGRYGTPRFLRTDNEAIFTSRLFRGALSALSIRHQTIDPGCPWQNGRIERFFGTVKSVLDKLSVPHAEALAHTLQLIGFWYNEIRPHQHLKGRTPQETWRGIDPYSTPYKEHLYFEALDGLITGYYLRQ